MLEIIAIAMSIIVTTLFVILAISSISQSMCKLNWLVEGQITQVWRGKHASKWVSERLASHSTHIQIIGYFKEKYFYQLHSWY